MEENDLDLSSVLTTMIEMGASDLHLTVSAPPLARVNGDLVELPDQQILTPQILQRVIYAILTQKQRERFEAELELDLSYSLPGQARFRVNVYRQREALGAAFRRIPYEIHSLEKLGIPKVDYKMQNGSGLYDTNRFSTGQATTLLRAQFRDFRVAGTISSAPRGTNGFGWDAIFIPDGETRTFGELTADEKDARSHRRAAWQALVAKRSA